MSEEALSSEVEAEAVEAPEAPEAPQRTARDSVREALERATQDRPAFERAPEETAEAQPEAEEAKGPERGPDGKFKARDGESRPEAKEKTAEEGEKTPLDTDDEPPARFSADAKQAWKDAPEAVKAEIRRALAENEKGLTDYQKRWEPLKRFDDMARQSGTTLHEAMERYVGLETLMRKDPIKGLDAVARNAGFTLEQVAQHILGGQEQQGEADPRDAKIQALEQHIQRLTEQVGGVTQNLQNQHLMTVQQKIDAARAEMPRFDELQEDMAALIQSGIAKGDDQSALLLDAYRRAEAMNAPAPQPMQAAPPTPQPAFEEPAARAHTPAPLSVQGAPATGSNPARRRDPSPNVRSSVKRALAQAMRV